MADVVTVHHPQQEHDDEGSQRVPGARGHLAPTPGRRRNICGIDLRITLHLGVDHCGSCRLVSIAILAYLTQPISPYRRSASVRSAPWSTIGSGYASGRPALSLWTSAVSASSGTQRRT